MSQSQLDEKPIPHNTEAEEALIGALLIDRDVIIRVVNLVSPEDFFNEERGNVYRAICKLYQEQIPPDLITVRDTLKRMDLLGDGEGQVKASNLFTLMHSTPSPVHAEHYARVVREFSLYRKLIGVGTKITALGFDTARSGGMALSDASTLLQQVTSWFARQQQDYFMPHEATLEFAEELDTSPEKETELEKDAPRLCFGWDCLDGRGPADAWSEGIEPAMLLKRSTITVISADSSVGKTSVVEQISEANARQGVAVLFFHNEISKRDMRYRRLTRLTGVPHSRLIQKERLTDYDREKLLMAGQTVRGWRGRIDFVHCPGWDGQRVAQEIRARHALMAATNGRGYDLFVMDYLQRMGESQILLKAGAIKAERVGENLKALGDVANELNLGAIVTSQVSRGDGDKDKFVKPQLHNNLYCGDIERFSNQVLGIWREGERAEFYGLKGTFGERDWKIDMRFIPERTMFEEV